MKVEKEGGKEQLLAKVTSETLTWINQRNINTVSGLKREGGGAATPNIPPWGPQGDAEDPVIPPPHHNLL